MSDTTEEELQKIINSNKSKNIKIDGKNYWISKKVKDEIKKSHTTEGGFLPLLALIPGIISGIGGAAGIATGIASGIANTVASSRDAIKKQKEIELLEKEIKAKQNESVKETTGSGLYLNPYQATAIHKYLKNNSSVPPEITKKFKNGIEIEIEGDGLYLNPYKK